MSWALAVSAVMREDPRHLKEWVLYHQLVGVEHFWLYDTTQGSDWRSVLDEELRSQIVEVIACPMRTAAEWKELQMESNRDAIRRAVGRADWLALIDLDEYLLPRDRATVPACLEDHYARASAVYVNWRTFGTGRVHLTKGESLLAQLVECSRPDHPTNATGKSLIRPERVMVDAVWSPHHVPLMNGEVYCDGDGTALEMGPSEPILDGRSHCRHMRINHYQLGDETYFREVRLRGRSRSGYPVEPQLEWEHYRSYSLDRDAAIVDLVVERDPGFFARLAAASG